jgi:hypothetical protein
MLEEKLPKPEQDHMKRGPSNEYYKYSEITKRLPKPPLHQADLRDIFFTSVTPKDFTPGVLDNKKSNQPSARWGHSTVIYNNYLWVFGGNISQTMKGMCPVYRLPLANDFSQSKWEKLPLKGEGSQARDSHTAVALSSGIMYIFGGLSGDNPTNDIFEFDMKETLGWSKWFKEDYSSVKARESHVCLAFDERWLFVIGGIGLTDSENSDSDEKDSGLMAESFVAVFDTKEKCARNVEGWEYQGRTPCERESHSVCKMGDSWYLFGGRPIQVDLMNDDDSSPGPVKDEDIENDQLGPPKGASVMKNQANQDAASKYDRKRFAQGSDKFFDNESVSKWRSKEG